MKKLFLNTILLASLSIFSACDDNEGGTQVDVELNTQILEDFSAHVAQATYNDLKIKASALHDNIVALSLPAGNNSDNLQACRNSWKASRAAWEQTESFLFGPVSTDFVDPQIDTWPVDFHVLENIIKNDDELSNEFIDNLQFGEKGFHAIEYLIFGENGEKLVSEISSRELEFLVALGANLKKLTTELADNWNPANANNYHDVFIESNQREAFSQMVNAMAEICGEVGNGKIKDVYEAKDASLEESPFSKNSITDFTNNMRGVQNVYLGKYTTDGKGLEDLVRKYNLQLDSQIKVKIAAAIAALNTITDPFGKAITTQPIQVQNAINAISDLSEILENDLYVLVQQHSI